MIKHKDFEDFILDYWGKNDGMMFLDDDQPDAFDAWLCNLEPDEWLELGTKYGEVKKGELC